MPDDIAVFDLFAGPGGLGEGFSSFRTSNDAAPFRLCLSVEKEKSAHRTLTLRAFLREWQRHEGGYPPGYLEFHAGLQSEPVWSEISPHLWKLAAEEARRLTLGTPEASNEVLSRARTSRQRGELSVLIGGPPCQAYSLVGRSRNRGIQGYNAAEDHRHFLYRSYLEVLETLRPGAFVMENVRGLLSAKVDGTPMFPLILDDLWKVGDGSYDLFPLSTSASDDGDPRAHLIRADAHGVPQERQRVILLGLRHDVVEGMRTRGDDVQQLRSSNSPSTVSHVLTGMPPLRSGLSRDDDARRWRSELLEISRNVAAIAGAKGHGMPESVVATLRAEAADLLAFDPAFPRSSTARAGVHPDCAPSLEAWLTDDALVGSHGHASRGHMPSDLQRYWFAACWAKALGRSPKARDYPLALAPEHANWTSGKFNDRFRVQLAGHPSRTITSHISKDGHYYIHPDPQQCRSLTVREAARLQTFPDDYIFLGNRTEQYVQVGNAVPPFLARQIASIVHQALTGVSAEQPGQETPAAPVR